MIYLLFACNLFTVSTNDWDSVWGLDVSHHQKKIEWTELEKSKPHFVFLKATEGTTHKDKKYKEYKQKFEALNIPVGAYHFFSYTSPGASQAQNYIKTANLKQGNLYPVLDVEYQNRKNMPEAKIIKKEITDFIDIIEKELGVKPIIYCECPYYNEYLKEILDKDYPLWIASFSKYQPNCGYVFWQKTDQHVHKAFEGTIDYNTFNGTKESLQNYILNQ